MVETVLGQILAVLQRLDTRLGRLRLGVFAVAIGGVVVGLRGTTAGWVAAGTALLVFPILVVVHDRIQRRMRAQRDRLTLRRERNERLRSRRAHRSGPDVGAPGVAVPAAHAAQPARTNDPHDRLSHYPDGPAALDAGVVDDLQLLAGPRNLLGFLDTSATIFGTRRLAALLVRPLEDPAAIRLRQAWIAELAARPAARRAMLERLATLRGSDLARVDGLLAGSLEFAERRGVALVAHLLGSLLPGLLLLSAVWPALLITTFPLLITNLAVIGRWARLSNPARDRLVLLRPLLDGLLGAREALATLAPAARLGRLVADDLQRVESICRQLGRRLRWLAFHESGVLFEIWNVLVLWELRILPGTERQVRAHRTELSQAIAALAELEALLALAGPLAEQRDFCLPELVTLPQAAPYAVAGDAPPGDVPPPQVHATGLAHPLLEPARAVPNDVALGGSDPRILLVTGSNMAGKSTYLKAIGANLVLAAAGGPVCARRFRWTPVALHTDVNVRDSLDDGKSYFQVEVERVRAVLDEATRRPHVLALFDELFRGTNSIERQAIVVALLRHLRDRGVLAVVATHDLQLNDLVTVDHEPQLASAHFEETVVDGAMRFDYRCRPGPARTRNAIRVLELSGYPPGLIAEARARAKSP